MENKDEAKVVGTQPPMGEMPSGWRLLGKWAHLDWLVANMLHLRLGWFLSQLLSCSNFYMLPFCSPCHAISKTVFIFTLAFLFLMWVLLAQNGHFYNVNLAQNLKTVITFYWNVRLSWYQHGWVCIYVLFPWIPIMGILVKPLVMAIWPIYGHFGHFGHIWPIWQWLTA